MTRIRPCAEKTHADLTLEWDRLAEERHRQITSGEDLSFYHVVTPAALRLLSGRNYNYILDIGSGTGEFTAQLAQLAGKVIAIEPSAASMNIARRVCKNSPNVGYVEATLERAVEILEKEPASAAVAIMTLMTAPNLVGFAKSLASVLQAGGLFVALLTHPCFWPRYWGYDEEPWFHYEQETFIEAPFVISKRTTEVRTTHIHRPLERYLSVFAEQGFLLTALVEPMPTPDVEALYPRPWEFPRFLGLRWKKII